MYDEDRNCYYMHPGYIECIKAAGGLPLILPLTDDHSELEQISAEFDGFLFTGGQDVDPFIYGEFAIDQCGKACEQRDKMEKILLEICVDMDKPCFGICRGIQLFNVMMGGTLYQDLPSQHPSMIVHKQTPPYDVPAHKVKFTKTLSDILGCDELMVNSRHHQAIKELSPLLKPAAYSEDELVEAVILDNQTFCMAVQWDPELCYHNDEANMLLLREFINSCRN